MQILVTRALFLPHSKQTARRQRLHWCYLRMLEGRARNRIQYKEKGFVQSSQEDAFGLEMFFLDIFNNQIKSFGEWE